MSHPISSTRQGTCTYMEEMNGVRLISSSYVNCDGSRLYYWRKSRYFLVLRKLLAHLHQSNYINLRNESFSVTKVPLRYAEGRRLYYIVAYKIV